MTAAAVAPRLTMPNLIVIGAAKCATTSLHGYLDAHPSIQMARPDRRAAGSNDDAPKEMRFFWREDWRQRLDWYAAHFDADAPVRGEATPAYSAHPFHPGVPERIAAVAPDARLIYLVRDPVDRLLAHWVQARVDGLRESLPELLAKPGWADHRIACPSRYATQLERYLEHFDVGQILVVDQADLRTDRRATLRRVFDFAGVDSGFWSPAFEAERNTREEKRALTPLGGPVYRRLLDPAGRRIAPERWGVAAPRVRRTLARPVERPQLPARYRDLVASVFAPEADRLRALTGQDFAGWSV
jgi:hypothetical protein